MEDRYHGNQRDPVPAVVLVAVLTVAGIAKHGRDTLMTWFDMASWITGLAAFALLILTGEAVVWLVRRRSAVREQPAVDLVVVERGGR